VDGVLVDLIRCEGDACDSYNEHSTDFYHELADGDTTLVFTTEQRNSSSLGIDDNPYACLYLVDEEEVDVSSTLRDIPDFGKCRLYTV
jgi:hypothetical protein